MGCKEKYSCLGGYTIIEVLMALVVLAGCMFVVFRFFQVIDSPGMWKDEMMLRIIDNTIYDAIKDERDYLCEEISRGKWTVRVKKKTTDNLSSIRIEIFYRDYRKPFFKMRTYSIKDYAVSCGLRGENVACKE
ncbi:MAG: hypothetical protein H0Z29_07865 [Candidatus Marinimicrobia bacterium]|nr:hypothetical protein [Candidatus Neomarinimicrobiota bacterium]